jgi:hypothetical protein
LKSRKACGNRSKVFLKRKSNGDEVSVSSFHSGLFVFLHQVDMPQ